MILQESVFLIKFIFLFFKIGLVHFEDIVVFVLYLYYKQDMNKDYQQMTKYTA